MKLIRLALITKFPGMPGVYDYPGPRSVSRFSSTARVLPSPDVHKVGAPNGFFVAQYPACQWFCLRLTLGLTADRPRLEVRMAR